VSWDATQAQYIFPAITYWKYPVIIRRARLIAAAEAGFVVGSLGKKILSFSMTIPQVLSPNVHAKTSFHPLGDRAP